MKICGCAVYEGTAVPSTDDNSCIISDKICGCVIQEGSAGLSTMSTGDCSCVVLK